MQHRAQAEAREVARSIRIHAVSLLDDVGFELEAEDDAEVGDARAVDEQVAADADHLLAQGGELAVGGELADELHHQLPHAHHPGDGERLLRHVGEVVLERLADPPSAAAHARVEDRVEVGGGVVVHPQPADLELLEPLDRSRIEREARRQQLDPIPPGMHDRRSDHHARLDFIQCAIQQNAHPTDGEIPPRVLSVDPAGHFTSRRVFSRRARVETASFAHP